MSQLRKKGLSTVVSTLLLVLLTLVLIGIVWSVIKNIVIGSLPEESCVNIFDKVSFNGEYTCYIPTSKELQFSINIADVSVDKIIISIAGGGTTKSVEIKNESTSMTYLKPFNGNYSDSVKLPDKNGGLTYVYNASAGGFSNKPDSIRITPVIGGSQCDVSDSIFEIPDC